MPHGTTKVQTSRLDHTDVDDHKIGDCSLLSLAHGNVFLEWSLSANKKQ